MVEVAKLHLDHASDRRRALFLSVVEAPSNPGRFVGSKKAFVRLTPAPDTRHSFMKTAKVSATEAGNSWIRFVMHHAPAPMLAVQAIAETLRRTCLEGACV